MDTSGFLLKTLFPPTIEFCALDLNTKGSTVLGEKKISAPCLKLHKDDSDTQKGSLVSSDPPRPGLSLIHAKQITDVPGETALLGAEHRSCSDFHKCFSFLLTDM